LVLAGLLLIGSASPARAHGDIHDKIEELSRRIEAAPTANLHFQRANLYFNHGDAIHALADLAWLDQHAPGTIETDPLRAEALAQSGRDEAALAALNRHLKLHPDATRCLALRARVQRKLGNTKAAILDYQAAIATNPHPEPDLILAAADALVAEQRNAEAITTLDAASKRLGPVPALAMKALEIEIQAGHWDGALARTAAQQASAPRPEPWMARRAAILSQAGHPVAAQKAWQGLLDHLSSLPPAERDSTAMSRIAAEARDHLTAEPTPPAAE
jgi:tetratricopeptide (TPR) repeat protein